MALGMCLLAIAPCVASAAGTVDGVTVRDCDVTTPASGKVLVGLKGSYDQVSAQKVLDKLNGIRKEACEEGVWNPENPSARLTMSDYKPMVWSADLEYITMLRAAEASVTRGHVRADGDSIWLKAPSGQQGWAEDLAWNYDDLLYGTGKVKVSKNGKVTVSKGLKKTKTYKVVLSVSCNGQSKQIAIKIKVK